MRGERELAGGEYEAFLCRRELGKSIRNKRARNSGITQDRILTESAAYSQACELNTLLNTLKLQQNDLDGCIVLE
jgi:hypothetical protein